jgi:hypothetical protein
MSLSGSWHFTLQKSNKEKPIQVPSHSKINATKGYAINPNKICNESILQKEEVGGRGHHV